MKVTVVEYEMSPMAVAISRPVADKGALTEFCTSTPPLPAGSADKMYDGTVNWPAVAGAMHVNPTAVRPPATDVPVMIT